jgi:hypothetical protein
VGGLLAIAPASHSLVMLTRRKNHTAWVNSPCAAHQAARAERRRPPPCALIENKGEKADAAEAPRASPCGPASCERSNVSRRRARRGHVSSEADVPAVRHRTAQRAASRVAPVVDHGLRGYNAHARSQPARLTLAKRGPQLTALQVRATATTCEQQAVATSIDPKLR